MTSLQQQHNSNNERDKLIENNISIVNKVYYKLTGKKLSRCEDEYSIGLLAIDEAIDKYNENKGAKFSTFCHTVIRGRLIDHFRKRQKEIPFSALESEKSEASGLVLIEKDQAIQAHMDKARGQGIKEEISELASILKDYNIDFYTLAEISPKHSDTRDNLVSMSHEIIKNKDLVKRIYSKKQLPIKELELSLRVKRKTLERHRRYLIVLIVILSQDYQYLSEYIRGNKNGS